MESPAIVGWQKRKEKSEMKVLFSTGGLKKFQSPQKIRYMFTVSPFEAGVICNQVPWPTSSSGNNWIYSSISEQAEVEHHALSPPNGASAIELYLVLVRT